MLLSSITTSTARWRRALKGSGRLIGEREEEKNGKHLLGCVQRECGFLPIVWTIHSGIGPPMAKLWLDSIFNHSYTKERIAGGSGIETSKQKNAFFQCLHACHTIGTTMMINYCVNPPASTAASAGGGSAAASAPLPSSLPPHDTSLPLPDPSIPGPIPDSPMLDA